MIPWSFLFLVLMGMWIACYKAAEDVTWKSTWPVGHLLDWDDNQALNLDSFIYPTSTTTLQEPDHAKLSYQVQSLNSEKAQNPYQFKETGETSGGPTNGLDRVVDATAMDLEPFTFRVRPSEAVGTRQASSNDDLPARLGQQATKPDALLRRPDLIPDKEDKLSFGQLLRPENITKRTFAGLAELDEFKAWFQDETINLEDAKKWFEINILGVTDEPERHEEEGGEELALSDPELLSLIRVATKKDPRLTAIMETFDKDPQQKTYMVVDDVVYRQGRVEVPADDSIKRAILYGRHNSKLAGHPGRAKTLALLRRGFTWPSQKRFVNQYVNGCDSCQQTKPVTQRPFGTLEPLPIPAGAWTDISYDLITDLPVSNGFDSVLTVVDWFTKMAHFIACSKTTNAEKLADIMIQNVWRLHGTPKTITSDRGSLFILQITRELSKRLSVRLCPSTAYHPRTDGQSEIANKAVEQFLHHFVGYCQDNWESLLAFAEFAHNNNEHVSTGMSPFKANYGFDPTFAGIPSGEQCLPSVKRRLQQIKEVQGKLAAALELTQVSMKNQFDRGVRLTPQWKIGDMVWLDSRNILTTRPSPKLGHRWLGPFPIIDQILPSVYKLTLPLSMKGIHPSFHVSVLRKHLADAIGGRTGEHPDPIIVEGEKEWEVKEVLDCWRKGKQVHYLIAWKGYGPEDNSWEPAGNLVNCKQLISDFNIKFPDAASRHKRSRRFK
ncbi:hypothetical protein PtA15_3A71 [Puccinia triticina]|uniref:Integrase catalytic domain-containing protein n=1 Tax=Puccinia triticina TaxID=208348 RepID=A0ABY7CIR9_9BASI|nr:uncharacterized protein PtA15_3A71 [Puccinia triticina]WAQ82707.1 hypothetical protein PtA15_3A71 [Puccinia triticina]